MTIAITQSQVRLVYDTPVYPHGTGPPAITDQITDQNTPYCDKLRYAVSNDIRMLAVTQRSGKELNYLPGAPFSPSLLNKFNDTSGLDHFSGPLLGPSGRFGSYLNSV